MHVTYDADHDQMYLYLDRPGTAASGPVHEILPWLRFDLDANQRILGIEIDGARSNGVNFQALTDLVEVTRGSWTDL